MRKLLAVLLTLSIVSCAPRGEHAGAPPPPWPSETFHLGRHTFPISTTDPAAQAAFDRGLTLSYAFSHAAAEQEFRRAAALDPQAPMPWWGVALVNGPHINFPAVPEERAAVAWEALTRARERASVGSPLEQALIEALGSRYVEKQPKDRAPLDEAYAAAMKRVWQRYPANADAATLYAEAAMDLHPWDLWNVNGTPKSWTPEILATLERAMALNASHPGANHLYIHAVEGSPRPERGVTAADTLADLVPGAGHLVHMPAHIYIRVGRLEDAAVANEKAIAADQAYHRANPNPGFYALYMLHNHHFLTFTRMMQGRREAALHAAREMLAGIPPEFMKEYGPIADGYMVIVPEVLMRFGQWNQILAEPEPAQNLPVSRAMWRFTRTVALNALDRRDEARTERRAFHAAVNRVPQDATFGNNPAHKLLRIAKLVADGEMAVRENRFDAALAALRKAAVLEDSLRYDEPPDWILPVRHTLGITLLRAGKPEEAEKVYREDLKKFPGNGWSLHGLSRALDLQKRPNEAAEARAEFQKQWAGADTVIEASCLCQSGV